MTIKRAVKEAGVHHFLINFFNFTIFFILPTDFIVVCVTCSLLIIKKKTERGSRLTSKDAGKVAVNRSAFTVSTQVLTAWVMPTSSVCSCLNFGVRYLAATSPTCVTRDRG